MAGDAVKAAPFDYVAPRSAGDVVALLGDGTAVLAGGQSLMLELAYRRRRPRLVVDLNRVTDFSAFPALRENGVLAVGPLVRHRVFERPVTADPLGRLLAKIVPNIAHPPIRARGTMLGSLAYAHPAAEWAAVAVTLDAAFDLLGPAGVRTVPAAGFFLGPFATAARGELLAEVRLPLLPPAAGVGFVEHRRTHSSFALAAAIAVLDVRDGVVADARIGLANPATRARHAEAALVGRPATAASFARAGAVAAAEDARPVDQPHGGADYLRHAAGVLVRRALEEAYREC
jgi:carbon-monoxide dehydrogenase medium subunit